MTWRWISREFLASAEARAKAEHDNAQSLRHALLREECRADQERADRLTERDAHRREMADLLAKFTMLRMQGAQESPPAPVPVKPAEADLCKVAINAKFTGNRAPLRAAALRKLALDRSKGVDEMDILRSIEQGETDAADIPV